MSSDSDDVLGIGKKIALSGKQPASSGSSEEEDYPESPSNEQDDEQDEKPYEDPERRRELLNQDREEPDPQLPDLLMSDSFFLVLAKRSNPTVADREILIQKVKKLTDVPVPFIGINVLNFPDFERLLQDHQIEPPCTVLLRGSRCVEHYDYLDTSSADIARFTNIRIEAANREATNSD